MHFITAAGLLGLMAMASVDGFVIPSSQRVHQSQPRQNARYQKFCPSTTHGGIGRLLAVTTAAASGVNGDTASSSPSPSNDNSDKGEDSSIPFLKIRLDVNEKARTVTSVCTSGTLCTVSSMEGIEGAPFGSFVDYVLDDDGNPVLLMNEMSMHTINIRENALLCGGSDGDINGETNGRCMVTLFTQLGRSSITAGGAGAGGPGGRGLAGGGGATLQDVSRCSLTGTIERIDDDAPDMATIRMRYSLTHSYADQVMDSPKFAFYRLKPTKIYFVGGFGVLAKWVPVEEYREAAPDILAKEASDIVARLNRDHGDDLLLTAHHLLDVTDEIEKVRVTNVDRLGIDMRVTSMRGARRNKKHTDEFRIGFRIPVISVEDAKSEVLKIFQEAWEKGNGYTWDSDDELPGTSVPVVKIAADSLD